MNLHLRPKVIRVMIFLFSITLVGCVSLPEPPKLNFDSHVVPVNIGNGYIIDHLENEKSRDRSYGYVQIKYFDYDFQYNKELAKLNDRMASNGEIEKLKSSISKGGYIVIEVYRLTIGAANTKWFEFIIKDGKKEIYRKKGRTAIANVPLDNKYWWGSDVIFLPVEIRDKITLYVVDGVMGGRDEFIIQVP